MVHMIGMDLTHIHSLRGADFKQFNFVMPLEQIYPAAFYLQVPGFVDSITSWIFEDHMFYWLGGLSSG